VPRVPPTAGRAIPCFALTGAPEVPKVVEFFLKRSGTRFQQSVCDSSHSRLARVNHLRIALETSPVAIDSTSRPSSVLSLFRSNWSANRSASKALCRRSSSSCVPRPHSRWLLPEEPCSGNPREVEPPNGLDAPTYRCRKPQRLAEHEASNRTQIAICWHAAHESDASSAFSTAKKTRKQIDLPLLAARQAGVSDIPPVCIPFRSELIHCWT
jgi:hypothetical protein